MRTKSNKPIKTGVLNTMTVEFATNRFLPKTKVEISIEEIRHVISVKKIEGFYIQLADKKSRSTETSLLVRIKTVSLYSKKENQLALHAMVNELKLVPYQTKTRITGALSERKGQYIVDPEFMNSESTTDPITRLKTYVNGITHGWPETQRSTAQSGSGGQKRHIPEYGC